MARKIWDLRIMRDERSASDLGAPVLVVSQFTLYGDARKGRRPTWTAAAPGPVSEPLYDAVCAALGVSGRRSSAGCSGRTCRSPRERRAGDPGPGQPVLISTAFPDRTGRTV